MRASHVYRFNLARGFLKEAQQDVDLQRWRSAMDNAQLAVENAAKAVLALIAPVGRTHQPAIPLRSALEQDLFANAHQDAVSRLIEIAELLGPDIHIQTDYGDETQGLTPWDLFDEDDAHQALHLAEEAVTLAKTLIDADEF